MKKRSQPIGQFKGNELFASLISLDFASISRVIISLIALIICLIGVTTIPTEITKIKILHLNSNLITLAQNDYTYFGKITKLLKYTQATYTALYFNLPEVGVLKVKSVPRNRAGSLYPASEMEKKPHVPIAQ